MQSSFVQPKKTKAYCSKYRPPAEKRRPAPPVCRSNAKCRLKLCSDGIAFLKTRRAYRL